MMKEGPLTEKELEWLDEMLEKYGSEDSIVDVAELDGLLTAVLSGPKTIEPSEWLVALWGGQNRIPRWSNEREMNRFMDLCFQHMNDIADRLAEFPISSIRCLACARPKARNLPWWKSGALAICAAWHSATGHHCRHHCSPRWTPSPCTARKRTSHSWNRSPRKHSKRVSPLSAPPRWRCTITG